MGFWGANTGWVKSFSCINYDLFPTMAPNKKFIENVIYILVEINYEAWLTVLLLRVKGRVKK